MRARCRESRRGFTLIEMLVVVGILVLLASIVAVMAQGWILRGKQLGTKGQIDDLTFALSNYKTDLGSYPPMNLMIDALEDGLGGNIRWKGPYRTFEHGKVGTIGPGGRLENPRNSHLSFYGGGSGDAEAFFFVPGQKVYLDQFNRPIVYVPNRDYDAGFGTMVPNETSFYNPVSFQVFSFGADGKSVQANPGSLSYTDGIDNDGDGRIDQADNPKTSTADGKQVEDDLTNW